ncbi:MAG: hypothetical protein WCJ66_06665 [Verrucomicrobiota bacterium]
MKSNRIQRAMHRGVFAGGVCCVLFFACMTASQAAVALTWSGGNGAQLSLTLSDPVVFVVETAATQEAFDLVGAGNLGLGFSSATGLSYSVNGGSNRFINTISSSGASGGAISDNDTYFFGDFTSLVLGDVVTLNAGTLTTALSFAGAPPLNSSVEMFLFDSNGTNLGGGTAVPEASTALLDGLGLLGLLRRRRRA